MSYVCIMIVGFKVINIEILCRIPKMVECVIVTRLVRLHNKVWTREAYSGNMCAHRYQLHNNLALRPREMASDKQKKIKKPNIILFMYVNTS